MLGGLAMFFYLNEDCLLVRGKERGALYDFKSGAIYSLESEEVEMLSGCDQGECVRDEHREFLDTLVEEELGFYWPRKCFIEKRRPYSPYLIKKLEMMPLKVQILTIKLTDKCNASCNLCDELFCPICTSGVEASSMDVEAWEEIIGQLQKMGLQEVILTGGNPLLYEALPKLLDQCLKNKLQVKLVIHSSQQIPEEIQRELHLVVLLGKDYTNNIKYLDQWSSFEKVTLLNYHPSQMEMGIKDLPSHMRWVNQEKLPLISSLSDLKTYNMESFYNRKDTDDCMIGRVYMNHRGDILPCFHQHARKVGNVKEHSLVTLLGALAKTYWYDASPKGKCKGCELYYACISCRYTDGEVQCCYQPHLGTFIESTME